MTLAERLFWFKRDCGQDASVFQIAAQIGTRKFFDSISEYLFNIIADCHNTIKQMGDPMDLEGFEQIRYNDQVELHNRAVDLYNDLIQFGVHTNRYKGYWSFCPMNEMTTHIVEADTEDDAIELLMAWACQHRSILDDPCDFEVERLD